ncbi:MAG TPA: hypothetical protein VMJ64_07800 [Anaerolineales bacterium]|nr:hypothetical protein [Anaerolineales bacterium]
MADSPLTAKMKRKPGARAAIIGAPAGYEAAAFPDLEAAARSLNGRFDWIQVFVRNKADLDRLAPRAAKALKPESILWITFPKGTSNIQTDLTRDQGWDSVRALDLKWITLISVNHTWSAFGLRPYKADEPRQSFR